jgi:hypothetical protein
MAETLSGYVFARPCADRFRSAVGLGKGIFAAVPDSRQRSYYAQSYYGYRGGTNCASSCRL